MIKKWWVIAVVFTLALSLTSCSSKSKNKFSTGDAYVECNGSYFQFDVTVAPSSSNAYDLIVTPVAFSDPNDQGAIATVAIAHQASGDYDVLKNEVVLVQNRPIYLPGLTLDDLDNFDTVLIVPFSNNDLPNATLLERDGEKATACELPYPGDPNYSSN